MGSGSGPGRDHHPFLQASRCRGLIPDHRQVSVSQHRQGDVAIPAIPSAYLVLVQSHLSLGRLEAFLDGPAAARHLHQLRHCGTGRAEANVVGQLSGLGNAALGQQPVLFARLPQGPYRHGGPVIKSGTLGAVPRAQPLPARFVNPRLRQPTTPNDLPALGGAPFRSRPTAARCA